VAAKRFFRTLLKNLEYVPRVIVTDKLGSYLVAHRELLASVEHRRSKYLNNRIENSHQPTRQRERAMKRSHCPGTRSGSCPRSVVFHRIFGRAGTD
jgi:putative transposase